MEKSSPGLTYTYLEILPHHTTCHKQLPSFEQNLLKLSYSEDL